MRYIGTEIRVVPVRMREIEVDLDIALVRCIAEFLHNIAAKRSLHNRVGQVAGLDPRSTGSCPVGAAFHPRLRVEHGEAFVMLGGGGKNLHAAFLESVRPCVRIEARGSLGIAEVVVGVAIFKGNENERPGLRTTMTDRVDSPVNPDAELYV